MPTPPTNRLGGGGNVGAQRAVPAVSEQTTESGGSAEKLGGVFWWLLLGLMIMSDIGSVFCNLLVAAGVGIAGAGTAATLGLGAVAALPLGFGIATVGWAMGTLVSFNAFMFAMGYYFFHKVSLTGARKLATMGVSAIIELIPWVNMLPMLTISFLIVTVVENMKRGTGIVGKVAQKALAKTGPVGAIAGKVLAKA